MPERLPWIAADPASQRLLALAEKVAPAPTTLLITGESGSGKDYFARLIHELSPRRDAPLGRSIASVVGLCRRPEVARTARGD